jgi:hypothetical protein
MENDRIESENQQDAVVCPDCGDWAEKIDGIQRQLCEIRDRYADALPMHQFPGRPAATRVAVDVYSQQKCEDDALVAELESDLKNFTLGQLAHQRATHFRKV